jgi:hypothetical protein
MDMQGNIVHTWFYSQKRPWNSIHALLMDDGDLILAARLRETGAVFRIRWDGTQEWAINTPAHHDLATMPDGTVYVLVGDIRKYRGLDVEFSALVRYGQDGEVLERWSIFDNMSAIREAFDQRSFMDVIIDSLLAAGDSLESHETIPGKLQAITYPGSRSQYDYFHPNSITLLPDTPLGRKDDRFRG